MARTVIGHEGLELAIDYDYYPEERNNEGHPDTRLPNEEEDIIIHNVDLLGWDDEDKIKSLLKEKLNE